ncbi:MAG: SDR family oxidoreductase [Solirubrobacteraceae bacterium]|nr:SDR family oxidoreductase [Solirubrobacteraceae bacterium]
MDLQLTGRACVVTGGSSGIGFAVAERLAQEGARLLLVARGAPALAEAAARLPAGTEVATLAVDVTDPAAAKRIVDSCTARFGTIDVLVNNAGGTTVTPMDELTDADWASQWEQHVHAPMRLMRAAAPRMAQAGFGRIVNVTSSSGRRPSSQNPAYGVAKSGQLALSRAFAEHWAPQGVLVNAIAPGPAATELWTAPGGMGEQVAARRGGTAQDAIDAMGAGLPLGRVASAGEIADVAVFLCSPRASNVVGAVWSVDGGAVRTII